MRQGDRNGDGYGSAWHRIRGGLLGVGLLLAFIIPLGCEEADGGNDEPEPKLALDADAHALAVAFPDDEGAYVTDCTDYIKVFKGDGAGEVRLGKSALAEAAWDGYFLDDVFVPPVAGEGCDVLQCIPLADRPTTVAMAEYTRLEDRVLTDAEKSAFADDYRRSAHGENIPDSVAAFTTVPYFGEVTVELTYAPVEACFEQQGNTLTLTRTFTVE